MLANGYDLPARPAHDLDVERAVLGAMLIDPRAVEVAADLLAVEVFYHRAHAAIFRALLRLSEKGQAIDQVTAIEELKRTEELDHVGGVVYLAQLAAEVATSANVGYHARILLDKAARRTLATMGQSLAERAADPTVDLSP